MADQIIHFNRNWRPVAKDRVVTLRYAVQEAEGGDFMEYGSDLIYLHGGYGGAPAKVEQALAGLTVGQSCEVVLAADEGYYGSRDPALLVTVDAAEIPPEAHHIGARVDGEAPDGRVVPFAVTHIADGMITLDGNHRLAGKTLTFVLEILDVREATQAELEAGYAFRMGAGGQHETSN